MRYKKESHDEKKKRIERNEDVALKTEETIQAARHLLNMNEFHDYRKKYESLERLILADLKDFPFEDPTRYGIVVKSYLDKLKLLEALLKDVSNKARIK